MPPNLQSRGMLITHSIHSYNCPPSQLYWQVKSSVCEFQTRIQDGKHLLHNTWNSIIVLHVLKAIWVILIETGFFKQLCSLLKNPTDSSITYVEIKPFWNLKSNRMYKLLKDLIKLSGLFKSFSHSDIKLFLSPFKLCLNQN